MLEEIEFSRLSKLNLTVDQPEDMYVYSHHAFELRPLTFSESHGSLQGYDKAFDRINTRLEKPLDILDRVRYNASTSDDPVINQVS